MPKDPPSAKNASSTTSYSAMHPRHEQTFPTLSAKEIERLRRFGTVRRYADGESLFETGKPGPGMFILLSGHVAITQRDSLGQVTPWLNKDLVSSSPRSGRSGRPALVDGQAEGDVEALLIPPDGVRALLVAEADLGERLMRAMILRRVSLIDSRVGGPVLIGSPASSGMVRLQGFLTVICIICSIPRRTRRPKGFWRPSRNERPHRKLSRLSHGHFRPGADRARLRSGAEVWRRHDDPGRGDAARLQRAGRRVRASGRRR